MGQNGTWAGTDIGQGQMGMGPGQGQVDGPLAMAQRFLLSKHSPCRPYAVALICLAHGGGWGHLLCLTHHPGMTDTPAPIKAPRNPGPGPPHSWAALPQITTLSPEVGGEGGHPTQPSPIPGCPLPVMPPAWCPQWGRGRVVVVETQLLGAPSPGQAPNLPPPAQLLGLSRGHWGSPRPKGAWQEPGFRMNPTKHPAPGPSPSIAPRDPLGPPPWFPACPFPSPPRLVPKCLAPPGDHEDTVAGQRGCTGGGTKTGKRRGRGRAASCQKGQEGPRMRTLTGRPFPGPHCPLVAGNGSASDRFASA